MGRGVATLVVILSVLTAGCAGHTASRAASSTTTTAPRPGSVSDLEGHKLRVVAASDGVHRLTVVAKRPPTIAFGPGQSLTMDDGCNGSGGTFALLGNRLVLSNVVSSTIGCFAPVLDQTLWFDPFMLTQPRVTISGSKVEMTSGHELVVLGPVR